jgi:hypothetical protein
LVANVASGKVPAVEAQRIAADIVEDYGHGDDQVSSIAALGASGSRPANVHRDFLRMSKHWGLKLEPIDVLVTHRLLNDHGTQVQPHKVLFPHELFAAAYSAGDEKFRHMFLGDCDVSSYWDRVKDQPWARHHPAFTEYNIPRQYAIPIGMHADSGRHISRDKMLCIAWGSVLSRAPTAYSKQLFTVVPDELLVKHQTDEELYAIFAGSLICTSS